MKLGIFNSYDIRINKKIDGRFSIEGILAFQVKKDNLKNILETSSEILITAMKGKIRIVSTNVQYAEDCIHETRLLLDPLVWIKIRFVIIDPTLSFDEFLLDELFVVERETL